MNSSTDYWNLRAIAAIAGSRLPRTVAQVDGRFHLGQDRTRRTKLAVNGPHIVKFSPNLGKSDTRADSWMAEGEGAEAQPRPGCIRRNVRLILELKAQADPLRPEVRFVDALERGPEER